jgi:sarcosine oxidase
LARVSKAEAFRLSNLPSLLYEIDTPQLEGIYSTQPIQYPDGNFYLKMGCNLPEDNYFGSDLKEVQQWFRNGDSDRHLAKMKEALMALMPNLKIEGCLSKRCILPRTMKHENPYIGMVHEGLYLTTGNGWSAMCSDGAGKLMASLIRNGKIPEGFNSRDFEPVFE